MQITELQDREAVEGGRQIVKPKLNSFELNVRRVSNSHFVEANEPKTSLQRTK